MRRKSHRIKLITKWYTSKFGPHFEQSLLYTDISNSEQCNNNRIVAFYGSYQSRQSTQISICMEYLDGGRLVTKVIIRLPEQQCLSHILVPSHTNWKVLSLKYKPHRTSKLNLLSVHTSYMIILYKKYYIIFFQ